MSIAYAAPFLSSDSSVIASNTMTPPTTRKKTVKNRSNNDTTKQSSQLLNEIGHSKVQQMYNLIYNKATAEDSSSDLADYKPMNMEVKENSGAIPPIEFPESSNRMFHEGFTGESVNPSNKDLVANKFADATKGYNLPYASSIGDRRSASNAATNGNYPTAGTNTNTNTNELMTKMNYMIKLLEEQKAEKTDNVTEELVLYVFLGVFVIFTVDSFSKIGKYVR